MIVVLAIDALEIDLVEEFNCSNLKQKHYGKTDITEFSEPRTMVLWCSFMSGKNIEKKIMEKGDKEMWNTKIPHDETFFKEFDNPKIIDLPGFSYEKKQHDAERALLKSFFDAKDDEEKTDIRKKYNAHAFEHHREIKREFANALKEDHDFVLGYFSLADVIGHLNFGNRTMIRMIYRDLDEIAGTIKTPYTVLSDHGMVALGIYGDHSNYGFWSSSEKNLGNPKITDFESIILNSR